MKTMNSLCRRLDELIAREAWHEALAVATELWKRSRDSSLPRGLPPQLYVDILFKVADLFRHIGGDSYSASVVLKRAYDLDAGKPPDPASASPKEHAAHRLGGIYEAAFCHHSAALWFGRALELARPQGVQPHILLNLSRLAQNLETLALYQEAGQHYREILDILSPLAARDNLEKDLWCLVPAAMYEIHHGDAVRGEAIMQRLLQLLDSAKDELPLYFAAAARGLGLHYLGDGRLEQAISLARKVMDQSDRFDSSEELRFSMHGLVAQALIRMRRLDEAIRELDRVPDLLSAEPVVHAGRWVENSELWIDVARIRVHQHDFDGALAAYEHLCRKLGASVGDRRTGNTSRKRLYWVRQQAVVVHEMVSAWLALPDEHPRGEAAARIANALLQLKANMFLALEGHRLVPFRVSEGFDALLFQANRAFAAAARSLDSRADSLEAMAVLEDALFRREQLEAQLIASEWDMIPELAEVFDFDFRRSAEIHGDTILLDYSLIEYRPPQGGMAGPVQGQHYVGVRLAQGGMLVTDLGPAEEVEALCAPLISELSKRPNQYELGPRTIVSPPATRDVVAQRSGEGRDPEDLDALARQVYSRIVAPLEPLSPSLLISPAGILAALPFHALLHDDRYLIEEADVIYCHSVLQKEALTRRQMSPGARVVHSFARNAVLIGDPDYGATEWPPLPGTKDEVDRIAALLQSSGWDEVRTCVGPQATATQVTAVAHPRVVHIAAHGSFTGPVDLPRRRRSGELGGGWRRWEEMNAEALSDLDHELLRAQIVLSKDPAESQDSAEGRYLSGLELSSLNLIGCDLLVLSACETGVGHTEHGAGVLGFQYALWASFAKTGIVSLWSVLDRETSEAMVDLYRMFLENRNARAAYLGIMRKRCRIHTQRVHPYYWAAFMLLDQDYRFP